MPEAQHEEDTHVIAVLGVGSSVNRFNIDFFSWVHAELGLKPADPLPEPLARLYEKPAGEQTWGETMEAVIECGVDLSRVFLVVRDPEGRIEDISIPLGGE